MILKHNKPLLLLNIACILSFISIFTSIYYSLYTYAVINAIFTLLILILNNSKKINGWMKILFMILIIALGGTYMKHNAFDEVIRVNEINNQIFNKA